MVFLFVQRIVFGDSGYFTNIVESNKIVDSTIFHQKRDVGVGW